MQIYRQGNSIERRPTSDPDPEDYSTALISAPPPSLVRDGDMTQVTEAIILPSPQKLAIAGLFPVHNQGENVFTCGGFNSMSGFQKLAAFLFAIKEVNSDPYLLSNMELGALAMDSCSSSERALSSLFDFLSGDNRIKIEPRDLVSMVALGSTDTHSLHNLLLEMKIPQLHSIPTPLAFRDSHLVMGTVPSDDFHVQLLTQILNRFRWSYCRNCQINSQL